MAKGKNIIIKGVHRGRPIVRFNGKIYIALGLLSLSEKNRFYLNSDTVKDYELLMEATSGSAKRGLIGGAMFGVTGAVVGAATGKTDRYIIKIHYKESDESSILELDGKTYEAFLLAMN